MKVSFTLSRVIAVTSREFAGILLENIWRRRFAIRCDCGDFPFNLPFNFFFFFIFPLLFQGEDKSVRIWNVQTWKCEFVITEPFDDVCVLKKIERREGGRKEKVRIKLKFCIQVANSTLEFYRPAWSSDGQYVLAGEGVF